MKLMNDQKLCAICNQPLKWWNSQSCIDCGKVVCGHHAHAVKRQHSSVLLSYCVGCSDSHSHTQFASQAVTHKRQHELGK